MFFNDIEQDKSVQDLFTTYAAGESTYPVLYEFWKMHLFERCIRLFVWESTPVDQKEIEQRLILQGYTGIAPYKGPKRTDRFNYGELTAFFGSLSGVTKYIDEKVKYIAHCPVWTKTFRIGEDLALINNSALRIPTMMLIHHYACMLAHADVSLIMCTVNHRADSGIPVAKSQKHKQSIKKMQTDLFNGKMFHATDIGDVGLEFVKITAGNSEDIVKLYEVREKLIKSFYADIGVRSAFEKNNNTVNAEITSDQSFLLLNVADMLEQRQKGCEEVNRIFGTNWSVKLSPEIELIKEGGVYNENSERPVQNEQA